MITVSVGLGALGLVCLLFKKNLLGLLVGVYLLVLGTSMSFVLAGVWSGREMDGHLFGMFIAVSGVVQIVVGYSVGIRVFYLKKDVNLKSFKSLRH